MPRPNDNRNRAKTARSEQQRKVIAAEKKRRRAIIKSLTILLLQQQETALINDTGNVITLRGIRLDDGTVVQDDFGIITVIVEE